MTILAYQTGVLYPGFADADRGALARVFETFGFKRAGARLRDIDPHRALSFVARRVGSHRKDGLRIQPLPPETDIVAYQVEQLSRDGRAGVRSVVGARIASSPAGLFVTAPRTGAPVPACMAFAEKIQRRAERLVTHADTRTVSRAVKSMADEAQAFRFIARGSYMLSATDPIALRVVGCFRELRLRFYDEESRTGLRASVVEVTDHGENRSAVCDAITDEADRQIAVALDQLRAEAGSESLRPETLEKRRRQARVLVDSLREIASLLEDRNNRATFRCDGARLLAEARSILGAYEAARTGHDLSVPLDLSDPEGHLPTTTEVHP